LFNCCSNQGLRLRIWAMRHASILRKGISSDSNRWAESKLSSSWAKCSHLWKFGWLSISTLNVRSFAKKWWCMMPMITMACVNVDGKWMQMVRSLMHVEFGECISIQCSNQHCRSGNARIH
jgi:hypothetical protein